MARVLFIAFVIGVTLYALIDWALNSKRHTPGGLSRWLWLAVIVFFPIIGPSAWIILRLVNEAEARQNPPPRDPPQRLGAPDDDPEFLDNWAKKIERRQRRSRPSSPESKRDPTKPEDPDSTDPGEPDDRTNGDDSPR